VSHQCFFLSLLDIKRFWRSRSRKRRKKKKNTDISIRFFH